MELAERKNTTQAGLTALENLMETFDFANDISMVDSPSFGLVTDIGGDQDYLWSETGFFRLKNGNLQLFGYAPNEYNQEWNGESGEACWTRLRRIDFAGAMSALEGLVTKYNEVTSKKDEQIENFLKVCAELKTSK